MKKKVLSAFMAICMILSMMPATVFATAEETAEITGLSITVDGVTTFVTGGRHSFTGKL